MPRVLVACEMSGRVRTAFAARGWYAVSADLLPDETHLWNHVSHTGDLGTHYQGDALDIIRDNWDLVIAHPPCTDLSNAGNRYRAEKIADGRQAAAAKFFRKLYDLPCPKSYVVVENPMGAMSQLFSEPDQIVEPWMFGDPLRKKTCLWYRGANISGYRGFEHASINDYDFLPHLVPTHWEHDYGLLGGKGLPEIGRTCTGGGSWRTDKANGLTGMNRNWEDSQGRARRNILRSITPEGFARACAEQFGPYIESRRA
jgi:site-specific DNA-cytosine methylase